MRLSPILNRLARLDRAVCAGALLIAMTAAALAQPAPEPPRLVMTGVGEANLPPDMATITVGVVSEAATAAEALAANTRAMTAMLAALREAGVQDRDLRTQGFSIVPRYAQDRGSAPRIVGSHVSNSVVVRVRELPRVGAVLDRITQLGANSIQGPVFGVSNPAEARDAARRAAVEDARRRATVIAESLGVRLGRVVFVTEGQFQQAVPRPMMARSMSAEAASAPVPIEAGEQTLSAMVTVTWELRE